ncbi:MAG: GDSL-type esterase/lipase family protein [Patescibacteria group bacterium]|nr:GDSL-type esterase/lipase family protein [Patescibacteria group bacterium]
MSRILIFGDSITYGAWDKEGGWAQRLRKYVDEKIAADPNYYHLVYNLGISGNTSEDLLMRFENECKYRKKEEGKEELVIIIAIGENDSQIKNGKVKMEMKVFEKNLDKLLKLANKFSGKIFFVGLCPVDESKSDPIAWAKDKSYKNDSITKYNDAVRKFCEKNNLGFIDVFSNLISKNYKELLDDGVHPNTNGHQQIFEIIKDYLIEKNII